MGGVYFGFGILEFPEGLSMEVPDAHMIWIINDLTVTGGIKEAAKATPRRRPTSRKKDPSGASSYRKRRAAGLPSRRTEQRAST